MGKGLTIALCMFVAACGQNQQNAADQNPSAKVVTVPRSLAAIMAKHSTIYFDDNREKNANTEQNPIRICPKVCDNFQVCEDAKKPPCPVRRLCWPNPDCGG